MLPRGGRERCPFGGRGLSEQIKPDVRLHPC